MPSNKYFRPEIFDDQDGVAAVHTLRDNSPDGFSVLAKNTTEEIASQNRVTLTNELGFATDHIAVPREVHGSNVLILHQNYVFAQRPDGDAIVTHMPGWLIGATVADCVAVLFYDPAHRAIGVAHSGWRGSAENIVAKTLATMGEQYHTEAHDVIAYVSPAPHQQEYGVLLSTAALFDPKYSAPKSEVDAYFDNQSVVYDQLLAEGLKPSHIQRDGRSTISDLGLHSFRRDREQSGRMFVGIGLKA